MADIRINSLPSTATSTASDDFIAIDGATNGTRKMAARTPVFNSVTGNTTTDLTLSGGSSGASLVLGQGASGYAGITGGGERLGIGITNPSASFHIVSGSKYLRQMPEYL